MCDETNNVSKKECTNMKKTLGLMVCAFVCAVVTAVAVSAGAESITFGPSAAHMGADVAIVSPTTTGTQEFYVGGNFNAHAAATGANVHQKWQKDAVDLTDGGSIAGSDTANLVITGLVAGDAGVYTCVETGDCGLPATTPPITVVVYPHLAVTPPVDTYLCVGGILDKIITVSGGKLPYDIINYLDSSPSYIFQALSAGHFYLVRIIVPLVVEGRI